MNRKQNNIGDSPNNKAFDELQKYEGADRVISSHEMKESLKSKPEVPRVKLNFPSLDKKMEGLEPGELNVISGPTKEGKTTLAQTFTANLIKKDIKSLWFTYELPAKQFLEKFPELPLFYLPRQLPSYALEWIEKKIIEAKLKYGVKAVFIDHLHYLVPFSKVVNMSLVIGGVMRELKRLAREHEVMIFLIAHTQKIKINQEPSLSDIRDSSFISQEADFVLMIWRLYEKDKKGDLISTNQGKIKLAANRRTGEVVYLKIQLVDNLFAELDEKRKE